MSIPDSGRRSVAARAGVVDVARLAGVAPSTVSNVFNRPGTVSDQLTARVLDAARELRFTGADPAGRSLRKGRTNAIGVVLRERLSYSFDDIAVIRLLQEISEAADPRQQALVIVPSFPEAGATAGPSIQHVAADGIIAYSLVGDDPLLEVVRRRHVPTVLVDSPREREAVVAGAHFVGIDEAGSARSAVEHLLALGHRHIGILSTRLSAQAAPGLATAAVQDASTASTAKGRLAGVRQAFADAGMKRYELPVVQGFISNAETGRVGTHTLLDAAPRTTAVFAFSDALALGARVAAADRGLSVPAELSIVGFDDSADAAEGLTTVHQPLREKGRVATERLLALVNGPETLLDGLEPATSIELATALVVRGSTAPPA